VSRKYNNRDYTRNHAAAQKLADSIQEWYHIRGHKGVVVEVEEEKRYSDFGTKLDSNFYIISNINFNVDNISDGMLE